LGQPEALFGLDVFHIFKDLPETTLPQVIIVDPEVHLTYEAQLVYAHYTPNCAEFDEAPWLLAPQSSHQPWHMHMRFYVPTGKPRGISILFAVKPKIGFPEQLEIAVQAADAFHRHRLGLAGLLLAASVEAILRPLVEAAYDTRAVRLPQDLGFAALLERAQLLFRPRLGGQLVGHLRRLSKQARNPSAHGRAAELVRSEVAMWMVDVAVLYEWSRVAVPDLGNTEEIQSDAEGTHGELHSRES